MNFKDHFSKQSSKYARYRPVYPQFLYDYVLSFVLENKVAWDCATGNGQVARVLSGYFEKVIATDASRNQLLNSVKKENIFYLESLAEYSGIKENTINLVTVAQALHWFDFEPFYNEVRRVARDRAIIAVWAYGLHEISTPVDRVIKHFYTDIVGNYWPKERIYIDERYFPIPFPFKVIKSPEFKMELYWDLSELTGYLYTWSSVQKFIQKNNRNPLNEIEDNLKISWGDEKEKKKIIWPLYFKLGIIEK